MYRILAAILALGALAAATLIGPGASAQSPGGRTLSLTELEKGATFKHIRNTKPKSPRANSLGDVLVFTNPLADASGRVVGRLHVSCATTAGARNFLKSAITCLGTYVLRDGTLTAQGTFRVGGSTTTIAITGGTGAYANARGVLVTKDDRGGSHDTITLAG
jgi:Allene oxide cyclase barrel like domain